MVQIGARRRRATVIVSPRTSASTSASTGTVTVQTVVAKRGGVLGCVGGGVRGVRVGGC